MKNTKYECCLLFFILKKIVENVILKFWFEMSDKPALLRPQPDRKEQWRFTVTVFV